MHKNSYEVYILYQHMEYKYTLIYMYQDKGYKCKKLYVPCTSTWSARVETNSYTKYIFVPVYRVCEYDSWKTETERAMSL